jgi:L-ascorbate metabolism protein UlaG (beta-lactamase superfamily)
MVLEMKRLHLASLQGVDALAELDLSPADIGLVINTHLHFDHCGQNAVFKHAPFYVQRAELNRMRRDSADLYEWYAAPAGDDLPAGQASDVEAWRESVRRIRSLRPGTVHFCHHTDLVHS